MEQLTILIRNGVEDLGHDLTGRKILGRRLCRDLFQQHRPALISTPLIDEEILERARDDFDEENVEEGLDGGARSASQQCTQVAQVTQVNSAPVQLLTSREISEKGRKKERET